MELLQHYINELNKYLRINEEKFKEYYYGYVLIRIMQAMGSYGFRGFYENKKHFLKSIPFAVENLKWIVENVNIPINISTLKNVWEKIIISDELKKFRIKENKLTVT